MTAEPIITKEPLQPGLHALWLVAPCKIALVCKGLRVHQWSSIPAQLAAWGMVWLAAPVRPGYMGNLPTMRLG